MPGGMPGSGMPGNGMPNMGMSGNGYLFFLLFFSMKHFYLHPLWS